jgi:protein-arginine kinase activator protein McsA
MYIFSTKGEEDKCPICGFKISHFLFEQRIGCSFCYLFLDKALKNLIISVQDGSTEHVGRRNAKEKSLLKQFFFHVIDNESKKNETKKQTCEELKFILEDYF